MMQNNCTPIIKSLRDRAIELKKESKFYLYIIIGILVSASSIYFLAKEITDKDIESVLNGRKDYENAIKNLNKTNQDLKTQYQNEITANKNFFEKSIKELQSLEDEIFIIVSEFGEGFNDILETMVRTRSSYIKKNNCEYSNYEFFDLDTNQLGAIEKNPGSGIYSVDVFFFTEVFDDKNNAENYIRELKSSYSFLNANNRYKKKLNSLDSLCTLYNTIQTEKGKELDSITNYNLKEIEKINKIIDRYDQVEIDKITGINTIYSSDNPTDYIQLWQLNITRFGTLILAIFLVRILIPQYRYNLKLSAFYDAQADTLELKSNEIDKVDIKILNDMLVPNIDFSNAPKAVYNELIEIIKPTIQNQVKNNTNQKS